MFQRKRRKAYAPDDAAPPGRLCDAPDCAEAGQYRAPRDRSLREFHWFCLDHVRAYNASWDFYKGMGPDEIEACLRADTSWQRPTWPLGRIGGSGLSFRASGCTQSRPCNPALRPLWHQGTNAENQRPDRR